MGTKRDSRTIAQSCIAVRIRLLNRMVTKIYDDALRDLNVRVAQLNLLVAVAEAGPIRPTELGRILQLEKSTLSRDVTRLLAAGWLRESPHQDARSHMLEITTKGLELIELARPAWARAQAQARRLLGAEVVAGIDVTVKRLWNEL